MMRTRGKNTQKMRWKGARGRRRKSAVKTPVGWSSTKRKSPEVA
jgi:hypothetical protein